MVSSCIDIFSYKDNYISLDMDHFFRTQLYIWLPGQVMWQR